MTIPSRSISSSSSKSLRTTVEGNARATVVALFAMGSAIAAISASPLAAIASKRLRPIQPTPANPSLGNESGDLSRASAESVSTMDDEGFEETFGAVPQVIQGVAELLERE